MDDLEMSAEVRSELAPGEVLRWWGRPRQGLWVRGSDALLIPFSILWCGFAVVWTVVAFSGAPLFGLFGLPFVGVGLYMVFGRFVVDARTRAATVYAVTDRRVLILKVGRRRSVTSTALNALGSVELRGGTGGRGTIMFGPAPMFASAIPPNWPGTGASARPRFDGIEDARAVYDLMQHGPTDAVAR